jgi:hypothetical protein
VILRPCVEGCRRTVAYLCTIWLPQVCLEEHPALEGARKGRW